MWCGGDKAVIGLEVGSRDGDVRRCRRHRSDGQAGYFQIGDLAGIEGSLEMIGECVQAAVVAVQEADIDAAGLARLQLVVERLPGPAEDSPGEEILAEHGVTEGLRLLDEGADQVAPIDLTDGLVAGAAILARQGEDRRGAEVADEPVVIDVDLQPGADEAGRARCRGRRAP